MAFNALKFLPVAAAFHAREALAERSCATTGSFSYMDFRHQLPASCSTDAVFVPDFCNVTRITMQAFASRFSPARKNRSCALTGHNSQNKNHFARRWILRNNCSSTWELSRCECKRLHRGRPGRRSRRMYISNHQVWLKVMAPSSRGALSRKRKRTSAGTGSALRRARVAGWRA